VVIKEIKKISEEWKDVDNLFRLDGKGFLRMREGVDAVVCGVENVIMTRPGERVMRPDFGCYVYRYLFEPLHPVNGKMIGSEIITAVKDWETRAEVESMDVVIDYTKGAYIVKMQIVVKDIGETIEVVRILIRE